MKVVITTAVKLPSEQLKKVQAAITKKYGKDVVFESVINPEVIGGIRLTVGSRQVDGTIVHKLDIISSQLLDIG